MDPLVHPPGYVAPPRNSSYDNAAAMNAAAQVDSPRYTGHGDPRESNAQLQHRASEHDGEPVFTPGSDYRSVDGSAARVTPLERKSQELIKHGHSEDVAENPMYHGSPDQDMRRDLSPRSRRFHSTVRQVLDDLPSARREFYNLVESAAKTNQKVDPEEINELMRSTMSDEDTKRASPRNKTTRRNISDPLESRLVNAMDSGTMHPKAPNQFAFSDQELNQANGMLDLVREQDSRMSLKRERARKLNLHIKDRKQKIGRFTLWYMLTRQRLSSYISKSLHALDRSTLWQTSIKILEGKHGAHVGIYFKFLRWCLLLNILIACMTVAFIVIPYTVLYGFGNNNNIIHGQDDDGASVGETTIGLFNGGGALNASAYFMGVYYLQFAAPYGVNTTGSVWNPTGAVDEQVDTYDVSLAYLLTCAGYMLLSFIFIFNGVYDAIKQSVFGYGIHHGERLSSIVFCRFDHSLTNATSLRLHMASTARELRETLGEADTKIVHEERLRDLWKQIWAKRIFVNIVIISILVGCLFAIFATVAAFSTGSDFERLIPAIVLAAINAGIPLTFEILAEFEEWRTQLTVIKLTIIRAVVLRFVGLYVFIYASYRRKDDYMCWESYLGQEAYTVFVAGSLIFEMFTSTIIDMAVTIAHRKIPCVRVVLKDPAYFDTVKKTLEMTFAQSVIWLGTYFSPLLPLAGIARIIVLFYLQKWSTMTWCRPKGIPFLSEHSLPKLIWSLFLTNFLLAAIPLGYVIPHAVSSGVLMNSEWQDRFVNLTDATDVNLPCGPAFTTFATSCEICLQAGRVATDRVCWKPLDDDSGRYPDGIDVTLATLCAACPEGCGPFRNQESAYYSLQYEYSTWPDTLQEIINFMGTVSFTVILAFALLSCCMVSHARASATAAWAHKLEIERNMERWDKRWILEKYAITFDEEKFDEYTDSGGAVRRRYSSGDDHVMPEGDEVGADGRRDTQPSSAHRTYKNSPNVHRKSPRASPRTDRRSMPQKPFPTTNMV